MYYNALNIVIMAATANECTYVPGVFLGALHVLTHLILTVVLLSTINSLILTTEETEAVSSILIVYSPPRAIRLRRD